MQKRSLFDRLLGRYNEPARNYTRVQLMGGFTPTFSSFGDNAYSSDVVRATIHTIATNGAKLKAKHVRRIGGKIQPPSSNKIERLLTVRPNPHMSAFDFHYKLITQLMHRNNAFALIQTDGFDVVGFYPINATQAEVLEHNDELYVQFRFGSGKQLVVPYSSVIHLRRFFNENDIYGESNDLALMPTLELIHTTNQGIINAVKSSARLRGLLKFTQAMLKDEEIRARRNEFVRDYLGVDNDGGIAALDAKAEFTELKHEPKLLDDKQMTTIEEKVFKYFNVNRDIVMSSYSEDQWAAFYESVIEPIAIQLSLELTAKLFTENERNHGNEIIYEANRLQYASVQTKIKLVEILTPLGLLTANEGREVFNLAPVEGGDRRLVSLNYVDADKANEYQLGRGAPDDGGGKTEGS